MNITLATRCARCNVVTFTSDVSFNLYHRPRKLVIFLAWYSVFKFKLAEERNCIMAALLSEDKSDGIMQFLCIKRKLQVMRSLNSITEIRKTWEDFIWIHWIYGNNIEGEIHQALGNVGQIFRDMTGLRNELGSNLLQWWNLWGFKNTEDMSNKVSGGRILVRGKEQQRRRTVQRLRNRIMPSRERNGTQTKEEGCGQQLCQMLQKG